MPKVSQTGWFKASLIDWGVVASSKAKLPQFNAHFALLEIFNEKDQEWYEYGDENETCHGFFCLRAKDKSVTKNATQIMKALDWDGQSYTELSKGDYSKSIVVIRVDEASEESNYSFEVNWIDSEDATPGGVKKMSDSELAGLDKQWAVQLKKDKNGMRSQKPAGKPSSPSSKTAVKDPDPDPDPDDNGLEPVGEETDKQRKLREKAERNAAQKKKDDAAKAKKQAEKEKAEAEAEADAKPKQRPRPRPSTAKKNEAPAECTDEEAWDAICSKQDELEIDDDVVNDAMIDACNEVAGVGEGEDCDTESFTGAQWAQVRDLTIEKLSS